MARPVHGHHLVHEDARGVDDGTRHYIKGIPRLAVHRLHAAHAALGVVEHPGHRGPVHHRSAQVHARLRQVHRHAGVVKLAVVIDDAALQPLPDGRRQAPAHRRGAQKQRAAVAEAERQDIVECQAAEVKEIVPPAVVGNHESLVLHQVGGIALHAAALAQGFQHQAHIAALQVAHAAVHQFRTAARGTLRKVVTLQQRHLVTARGGIDGTSQSGGTAAYDNNVPRFIFITQTIYLFFSVHGLFF